jgi:hypothetical protein
MLTATRRSRSLSNIPSCTGTIQPVPRRVGPIPIPGLPSNLFDGVPPMPPHPMQLREQPTGRDGRAIKHIHSHTPLNTSGCGDLALTCLLRSDLQPARPDAPNPDSHVKRTKPALLRRPAHARPSPGSPRKGAAQCSHDLVFPPRRSPLL